MKFLLLLVVFIIACGVKQSSRIDWDRLIAYRLKGEIDREPAFDLRWVVIPETKTAKEKNEKGKGEEEEVIEEF